MGDTIYERAGGADAFLRLAAAHHQRCLDDPELNHPFSHPGHPQHVERLAAYWAEVLGGPKDFTGRHGSDHPAMVELHGEGGIPSDWGDRFVACFVAAIDDARLPDDPELRRALHDYMRDAVDEVLSQTPRTTTMPHWDWNGRTPSP
jgi:hemoglobin